MAAAPLQDNEKNHATKTATRCRLLELPAELRLIIYEHYFAIFELDTTRVTPYSDIQAALLHTCRLVRQEALDAYEGRLIETEQERNEQITGDIEYLERSGPTHFLWGVSNSSRRIRELNVARLRNSEALGQEIARVRKVRAEDSW